MTNSHAHPGSLKNELAMASIRLKPGRLCGQVLTLVSMSYCGLCLPFTLKRLLRRDVITRVSETVPRFSFDTGERQMAVDQFGVRTRGTWGGVGGLGGYGV